MAGEFLLQALFITCGDTIGISYLACYTEAKVDGWIDLADATAKLMSILNVSGVGAVL